MVHSRPSPTSHWVSAPQMMILVASFFVALGSGTNYAYPAYSPQLGARLNISHTKLNIIALAGNGGVYISALLWGRMVDSRGPQIVLVVGFVFLLGGYSGIKYFYDSGLPPDMRTLSTLSFYALVFCNLLTGCGGKAGLVSCLNTTVKSFPDAARASTTGLVMAGFGLSALFFITISNTLFGSTTSGFLLILAVGTSCMMVLGFFFVRPIPPPDEASYQTLEGSDIRETLFPALEHHKDSRTPLLNDKSKRDKHVRYIRTDIPTRGEHSNSVGADVEVAHPTQTCSQKRSSTLDVHGKALFRSLDFWLLFSIFSMLAGTGYTYINNVGSMSQSLYAHDNNQYDEAQALKWQATQVSVISLTNFGGRIVIGFFSDFTKRVHKTPRSHSLALVAFLCLISQVVAASVTDISNLWIASALLGLAHGSIFVINPTVCLEWFGLPHFSENWGYICIAPLFSANLLAFFFGRNLDSHGHRVLKGPSPPGFHAYAPPQCLQGRDCYVDALYLTICVTFLSFVLSVWTGYRDNQKALDEAGEGEWLK